MPPGQRRDATLLLRGGFAAILLLIAVSVVGSVLAQQRSHQASVRIIRDAGRTEGLLGRIGRELSRVHRRTELAVTATPRELSAINELVRTLDQRLDRSVFELVPLLSPEELRHWRNLEEPLGEVRKGLAVALADSNEGRREDARSKLEALRPQAAQLYDRLDRISETSLRETQQALIEADSFATNATRLQVASGVVLFALSFAVAAGVCKVLSRQQAELADYIARIERANRDLDAFAGRIAHDLRSVLVPLQLAGPQLVRCADEPAGVRTVAARIDRVTRHAADLLEGLLAFARTECVTRADESAAVDAELSAVLEDLEPLTRRIDAKVAIEVDASLRAACSPAVLHILLLNLLSNAIKFMEGQPRREVRVVARSEGPWCAVTIEDTGPGIPREALDRVFEPFFRVREARVGGSGLGLATVRRIVDALGGEIAVMSAEGAGTRVSMRIRRAKTALTPPQRAPETPSAHPEP